MAESKEDMAILPSLQATGEKEPSPTALMSGSGCLLAGSPPHQGMSRCSSGSSVKTSSPPSKHERVLLGEASPAERRDLDIIAELERRCMSEVRSLENCAFAAIRHVEEAANRRIEEMAGRLQGELARCLLQQAEVERQGRSATAEELRKDLVVQRDLQSQVGSLRRDLNAAQAVLASLVGAVESGSGGAEEEAHAAPLGEFQATEGGAEDGLSSLERRFQACMHKVWALHQRVEEERGQREQRVSELREEIAVARQALGAVVPPRSAEGETALHELRRELDQGGAERQADFASLQVQVVENSSQLVELRRDLSDLRVQHAAIADSELTSASTASLLQRLDVLATEELGALRKRVDRLEDSQRSNPVRSISADEGGAAVVSDVALLQDSLKAVRSDLEGLAKELAEERQERSKAVVHIGQMTEDVAKAAISTVGAAESRFAAVLATERQARPQGEMGELPLVNGSGTDGAPAYAASRTALMELFESGGRRAPSCRAPC